MEDNRQEQFNRELQEFNEEKKKTQGEQKPDDNLSKVMDLEVLDI